MRTLLAITCLLLSSSLRAETQSIADIEEIRSITDRVMKKIEIGEFETAFAQLKPYWLMPKAEVDVALNQTLDQRGAVSRRFGTSIGTEFLCLETAGNSLAKLVYLEKFQRHAIVWRFYFYQPTKGWFVNTFVWNDNLPGAFDCDS